MTGPNTSWVAVLAACWLAVAVVGTGAQTSAVAGTAVAVATETVRTAFGSRAQVRLSAPVVSMVGEGVDVTRAVPEPASRTAGPIRFVLYGETAGQERRIGRLTARVEVAATHLRARRQIEARTVLTADDVEAVDGDIGRQVLSQLPAMDAVVGTVARKTLLAGELITPLTIVARPLVTSGGEVTTVARLGGLEVRGRAIAAQSGGLGDTVIVVNPDSRKRLRGRVMAEAQVEVFHGS